MVPTHESEKARAGFLGHGETRREASATLAQIADKLFTELGIEDAFIQQTESLEQFNSAKVPGGGGAWSKGHRRVRSFRVVMFDGKKTVEGQGEHLSEALRDAFQRLGRPEPAWIAETASYEQGAQLWGGKHLNPGAVAVYPPSYKRIAPEDEK